jgi:hypothetical protein
MKAPAPKPVAPPAFMSMPIHHQHLPLVSRGAAAVAFLPRMTMSSGGSGSSSGSGGSSSGGGSGRRRQTARPPPLHAHPTDGDSSQRRGGSSTPREPTSPPRPSRPSSAATGGVQWRRLLMYALIALPNLWWAPSPFPAAPSSSPTRTATSALIERLGLTAPASEAVAGLTDEQQLIAVRARSFVEVWPTGNGHARPHRPLNSDHQLCTPVRLWLTVPLIAPFIAPTPTAHALTCPQDVWKRVDKLYLDRTFNGQDWFALRQVTMKKKYKATQEVYDAIKVGGRALVSVPLFTMLSPPNGFCRPPSLPEAPSFLTCPGPDRPIPPPTRRDATGHAGAAGGPLHALPSPRPVRLAVRPRHWQRRWGRRLPLHRPRTCIWLWLSLTLTSTRAARPHAHVPLDRVTTVCSHRRPPPFRLYWLPPNADGDVTPSGDR